MKNGLLISLSRSWNVRLLLPLLVISSALESKSGQVNLYVRNWLPQTVYIQENSSGSYANWFQISGNATNQWYGQGTRYPISGQGNILYLRASYTGYGTLPYQATTSVNGTPATNYYWDIGSPVQGPTLYTNTFYWKNNRLIPMNVVFTGNSAMFPMTEYASGMQAYNFTFVTTNQLGWMHVQEVDGPYLADIQPGIPLLAGYNYDRPTTGGSNITFGVGANAAKDETLQTGFNALYSAQSESSLAITKAINDGFYMTRSNTIFVSNNIVISNFVYGYTNTEGNAALNAISNMLANSGDGGANFSNTAPWMFNGGTSAKADSDTADLRGKITGTRSMFGSFLGIGDPSVPNMQLAVNNKYLTHTFELNPMSNETLSSIAFGLKSLLEWFLTFYFVYWAVNLTIKKIHGLGLVPQLASKSVLGKLSGMIGLNQIITVGGVLGLITVFTAAFLIMGNWLIDLANSQSASLTKLALAPIQTSQFPAIAIYLFSCFIPWNYALFLLETAVVYWLYVEAAYLALWFSIKILIH